MDVRSCIWWHFEIIVISGWSSIWHRLALEEARSHWRLPLAISCGILQLSMNTVRLHFARSTIRLIHWWQHARSRNDWTCMYILYATILQNWGFSWIFFRSILLLLIHYSITKINESRWIYLRSSSRFYFSLRGLHSLLTDILGLNLSPCIFSTANRAITWTSGVHILKIHQSFMVSQCSMFLAKNDVPILTSSRRTMMRKFFP